MVEDFKATVFLPKTEFPMRAGLPQREPEILARWEEIDLYRLLREDSKTRERYVLHDGPPYANGHLHIGHALNKILKDVIVRAHQMLGYDANYVPGWDCHGLPIEWKVEEEYRARGQNKATVPVVEFRKQCRDFADHWIDIQRAEFKRLGVIGDWSNPYKTMAFDAEAQIFREFAKFLMNGGLYQGARPVLWSVVEQTALADAEVEYQDHTSTTIHVRFPVVKASLPSLEDAAVVIWTTTPWTIPGNRAVAYNPDLDYVVIEVTATEEGSLAKLGERLVVAEALWPTLETAGKLKAAIVETISGAELAGSVLAHPLAGQGYDFPVPLLPGTHVTDDAGTGLVHTAPGHGLEDFEVGKAFNLEIPLTVQGDGTYYPGVPLFAGLHVYKADGPVADALREAGTLLARGKLVHSYPHSWRSKAPLIYRNTPQWFISMEANDLRKKALKAVADTRWVPDTGRNRIGSMIEQRPDWCISRQRSWGVPLAVFVDKRTGEPLRDEAVNQRIADAFAAEGGDVWFASPPERFLGNSYNRADYEQIRDVVEVWFDSGSSHAFVLEARPDLKWPADLYLEGSDQHRGWFHTSLLESCGTRGRAPYDSVLTHGFVLDEQGRKMSKSLGNVTAPQDVAETLGVDILRLWVVSSDYSEDLRIGPEILKYQADLYRRLRNTLRYLLGALDGWTEAERVDASAMPELERWVLHRLAELDEKLRGSIAALDFHGLYGEIHNFCSVDLSAFYFDICKDSLYTDHPEDLSRRACRTVMWILLDCLMKWLAPVLCFTAEEAWSLRPGATGNPTDSIHRQTFPEIPTEWRDDRLARKWALIRRIRRAVTGYLEVKRSLKQLGSSLQASVDVFLHPIIFEDYDLNPEILNDVDFAKVFIVSSAVIRPASELRAFVQVNRETNVNVTQGSFGDEDSVDIFVKIREPEEKCERCWKLLPEVRGNPRHLCLRCDAVVSALGA